MMCLTEQEEMKTQGSTSWEFIFIVLAILALLCAGIYLWRLQPAQRPLVLGIRVELLLNNVRPHKNFKEP